MTTTLRSSIRAELGWTWRDTVGELLFTDSNRLVSQEDLDDGAATSQADAVWHALDQSLAAGGSAVFALDGLPQSMFGGTITVALAKVKALLIVNRGEGHLVVGGADASQWLGPFGMLGDTLRVPPGGSLLASHVGDGWPVEPGSKYLKLQALGGDALFDITMLGAAAGGDQGDSSGSDSSGY